MGHLCWLDLTQPPILEARKKLDESWKGREKDKFVSFVYTCFNVCICTEASQIKKSFESSS